MFMLRYGPRRIEVRRTERPTPKRARAPTARPSSGAPPVSGSGWPEFVPGMTPLGLSTGPGPPDPPGGVLLVGVGLGVGVGLDVGDGLAVGDGSLVGVGLGVGAGVGLDVGVGLGDGLVVGGGVVVSEPKQSSTVTV
jgi:hypothetical protein